MTPQQIYKLDSKGKTRVWSQEIDGPRYRTIAGILYGNLVVSSWTECVGKQGRSNQQQAAFEVAANYEHKLSREYHASLAGADTGAHYFKPMLAEIYEPFAPGYVQPKLDGTRCIATIDGLFSREGKPIYGVPHIHAALKPKWVEDPDRVFDGELYNHDLAEDFATIVSIMKNQTPDTDELTRSAELIQYHIYDLPSQAQLNFGARSVGLELMFPPTQDHGPIVLVETVWVNTIEQYNLLHEACIRHLYEGSMWRADAPYEQKRTKVLQKRKETQDAEFTALLIAEGTGNWAGVAKVVYFLVPGAKIDSGDYFVEADRVLQRNTKATRPSATAVRVSKAGIKGTKERAAELLHETHKVVTIEFFSLTPSGVPRNPIATKFWGEERTL